MGTRRTLQVVALTCASFLVSSGVALGWSFTEHEKLTEKVLKHAGWKNKAAIDRVVNCSLATDIADWSPWQQAGVARIYPAAHARIADVTAIAATAAFNNWLGGPNAQTHGFHFDNLFEQNDIFQRVTDLQAWMLQRGTAAQQAWNQGGRDNWLCVMGVVLHAVQDAYCHANYVLLMAAYAVKNPPFLLTVDRLDPDAMPTFDEYNDQQWLTAHADAFDHDAADASLDPVDPFPNSTEIFNIVYRGLQTGNWPPGRHMVDGVTPWGHRHPGNRSEEEGAALAFVFGDESAAGEEHDSAIDAAKSLSRRASDIWLALLTGAGALGNACATDFDTFVKTKPESSERQRGSRSTGDLPTIDRKAARAFKKVLKAFLVPKLEKIEHANFALGSDPPAALEIEKALPAEGTGEGEFPEPTVEIWAADSTVWDQILTASDPLAVASSYVGGGLLEINRP